MKNKAQSFSLSQMLVGLTAIGLVGLMVFLLITRGDDVELKVEENEEIRRRIMLMNVLLSSNKLVYSDDGIVHRGVLDKRKLDILVSNPDILSSLSYPHSGYSVKVVDLENGFEWIAGEDFEQTLKSPVDIKYPRDETNIGILSIDFNQEFPNEDDN